MTVETKVLNVEGMSCSHCERAVKNELSEINGVVKTEVDLESKTVTVDYDSDLVSVKMLADAIEEAGYEVK